MYLFLRKLFYTMRRMCTKQTLYQLTCFLLLVIIISCRLLISPFFGFKDLFKALLFWLEFLARLNGILCMFNGTLYFFWLVSLSDENDGKSKASEHFLVVFV